MGRGQWNAGSRRSAGRGIRQCSPCHLGRWLVHRRANRSVERGFLERRSAGMRERNAGAWVSAGTSSESTATAISADGATIVGWRGARSFRPRRSIWDPANGMRELDQVLIGLGVDLPDGPDERNRYLRRRADHVGMARIPPDISKRGRRDPRAFDCSSAQYRAGRIEPATESGQSSTSITGCQTLR